MGIFDEIPTSPASNGHGLFDMLVSPVPGLFDKPASPASGPLKWRADRFSEPCVLPDKIPPVPWILGQSYARGMVSATVGAGGAGKSTLLLAEALSLATGRDLVNHGHVERCRVLVCWGEGGADDFFRRMMAAAQHYQIDRAELAEWLFLANPDKKPLVLASGAGNEFRIDDDMEALEREIAELRIGCLIVDPTIKAHGINENDNGGAAQLVAALERMAQRQRVAVMLAMHTGKTDRQGSGEASARGASAFIDSVRVARLVSAKGKGINAVNLVSTFKANNGPKGVGFAFKLDPVPFDAEGNCAAVAMAALIPSDHASMNPAVLEPTEEQTAEILRGIGEGEFRVVSCSAANAAGKLVANAFKYRHDTIKKGPKRKLVEALLASFIDSELLTTEIGRSPGGNNQMVYALTDQGRERASGTARSAALGPQLKS